MSSSPVIAGRASHRDGEAAGFDLISNQPRQPASSGAAPKPSGRRRPAEQPGQAKGPVKAREESTSYDAITGLSKPAHGSEAAAAAPKKKKDAARAKDARASARARAQKREEPDDVDVMGRRRAPSSPRKRGTGKSTVTFLDSAGGGVDPITGKKVKVDADPRRSAKAKKAIERELAQASALPYGTSPPEAGAGRRAKPVKKAPDAHMFKDVNPITSEKVEPPRVQRSSSGRFRRDSMSDVATNPVTGAEVPTSPRKAASAGAFGKEMHQTNSGVDVLGAPKKEAGLRKSTSGTISRQMQENASADPVTGRVVDKKPVTKSRGRVMREMQQRPVNPITNE